MKRFVLPKNSRKYNIKILISIFVKTVSFSLLSSQTKQQVEKDRKVKKDEGTARK